MSNLCVSAWASVTPHVWSVCEWFVSQFQSFSPTSPCHLRCSYARPLAPGHQVYETIHYLPVTASIAANHSPRPHHYHSPPFILLPLPLHRQSFVSVFFFPLLCSLITVVFQFHGHFSPVINLHNMPITYYMFASVAIVSEFNIHFCSFRPGNWGNEVCKCVFLRVFTLTSCLPLVLIYQTVAEKQHSSAPEGRYHRQTRHLDT